MGKNQNKRQFYLICVLLVVVTVAVYWHVSEFDFTNFDDDLYVKTNPFIVDGLTRSGIHWALTTTYQQTWIPLVWMSYMLDHDLSAMSGYCDSSNADPAICHITNLILHIANVILLLIILNMMTRSPWKSAFIAMLFAIHPLHVESVAWIAERKDVLSTFFWLLTMLAYLHYVRKPGLRRYGLVVLGYIMGLMSKPMLVTLPIALLILDYWPLDRVGTSDNRISFLDAVREKIPLIMLAIVSSIITIQSSIIILVRNGRVVDVPREAWPLGERFANVFISYIQYIVMTLWPRNLAVFYPHPSNALPMLVVVASVLVFAVLCYFAFRMKRTRPYITAGWLWYVITLIPAIGFVQVGKAALADRFTYVPSIGLFIIVGLGVPDLLKRLGGFVSSRICTAGLAFGSVAILMVCSYIQTGYWHDSYTLFSHAIRVTGPNAQAHYNLGGALLEEGKTDEAIGQYRESIRINPDDPDVLITLARILIDRGSSADLCEATGLLYSALKICPTGEQVHNYLGLALMKRGKLDEAILHFRYALKLNPDVDGARANLVDALALKK